MNKSIIKAYYYIIPILIIGISFGFTSFPLTLAVLLPLFLCSDRHTVGIFFLMYGGPLGGVIRMMYPVIPIYGLLLYFIGVLLIWDVVLTLLRKDSKAIWGILVVLLVFGIFYLIGPKDAFALKKYTTMASHGMGMILGYYAFCNSKKINVESLALMLIVAALCMFAFCISKYNFISGSLTDYNWFRDQCMQHSGKWAIGERMLVGYQQIGMLVLFGTSVYLSQMKLSKSKALFLVLCGFQLIMMTGSRQAILGIVVLIAFRLFVFSENYRGKKYNLIKVLLSGIGLVAFFYITFLVLRDSSSNMITSTLSEGDEGRQYLFLEAITIFQDNPLIGAGIGGFNALTDDEWPHNFFLELLCETGLVGTIILLTIVITALYKRNAGLYYTTTTGQYYFLFLMALFVRVLVSSDLTESIELFSAVFAISISKGVSKTYHQRKKENRLYGYLAK